MEEEEVELGPYKIHTIPYKELEVEVEEEMKEGPYTAHALLTKQREPGVRSADRRWNPQPLQSEPTGFSDTNDIHNLKTSKICIFVCGLPVGPTTTTTTKAV